jgi:hypothetical protein
MGRRRNRCHYLLLAAAFSAECLIASGTRAQTLSNSHFDVRIGSNGEIASLQIAGDAFPTNYVMNASNAPGQNTADHEWVGELMFTYRLGSGAWTSALTNQSSDVRKISSSPSSVTVSYENAASASGVKNFKLVETYALIDDALSWQISVTNTSTQSLEFGDFGLPLPFNEYWFAKDVIYETRTVYHSFTGNNSSYITVSRPSGVGPFLLMVPDAKTGAGFEYMDNWRTEEHTGSTWAAGGGMPKWSSGLDVFYIHSNVIKSTQRGYLPNTSLTLAPGQSKTYAFKFLRVASHDEVKSRLYSEGLIDVTVVPGMMFATNMTGLFDLHTSKPIRSITAQYPAETTVSELSSQDDHHIYQLRLNHLGQNDLTVKYGDSETTTLQFYALEPIDAALQRHATFMVEQTRSKDASAPLYNVFDDWMMGSAARRGATGSWGWGDDWGWTKAEFLAEKNAQTPVATEVSALDDYLKAVVGAEIDSSANTVDDWWCPSLSTPMCGYDRPYAYPHVFNTFFSMYKVAHLYPNLVPYKQSADSYLMRAFGILKTLYSAGRGDAGTGYMGEQTLPEIIQALNDAKHTSEAQFVSKVASQLYAAFKSSAYPYGSEYSYDNTGEEAVYMAAKLNGDMALLSKVNVKTRACRGHQPVWYYYADPVTLNGENWWQFQYTASLVGYCMDDWLRTYSTKPEEDERLSYAAKIANISAINSGQIDPNPANLGAVSWTYQAMKGTVYVGKPDQGVLHNGWREMSGEADLGLFGAIRILSSDVAVDPLFGLVGYGCDVTRSGSCYAITPKDGVFKRLNLITEKLHLELERDRYKGATLSTTKDYIGFTLENQSAAAHMTKVTVTGLAAGTYPVTIDGSKVDTVTVTSGQPTFVSLSIGANPTYAVQIGTGCNGSTAGSVEQPTPTGASGTGASGVGASPVAGRSSGSGGASAPGSSAGGGALQGTAGNPTALTAGASAASSPTSATRRHGCAAVSGGTRATVSGEWLALCFAGIGLLARRRTR